MNKECFVLKSGLSYCRWYNSLYLLAADSLGLSLSFLRPLIFFIAASDKLVSSVFLCSGLYVRSVMCIWWSLMRAYMVVIALQKVMDVPCVSTSYAWCIAQTVLPGSVPKCCCW